MSEEIENFIIDLQQKGISFVVNHLHPYGGMNAVLSVKEVIEYHNDPDSGIAMHYGISKEAWLAWHSSEYRVICCGKTKTGRQCRATVPGFHMVEDPQRWWTLQSFGLYCSKHS